MTVICSCIKSLLWEISPWTLKLSPNIRHTSARLSNWPFELMSGTKWISPGVNIWTTVATNKHCFPHSIQHLSWYSFPEICPSGRAGENWVRNNYHSLCTCVIITGRCFRVWYCYQPNGGSWFSSTISGGVNCHRSSCWLQMSWCQTASSPSPHAGAHI